MNIMPSSCMRGNTLARKPPTVEGCPLKRLKKKDTIRNREKNINTENTEEIKTKEDQETGVRIQKEKNDINKLIRSFTGLVW